MLKARCILGNRMEVTSATYLMLYVSEGKTSAPAFKTKFRDNRTILVPANLCNTGALSTREMRVSSETVTMSQPSKGNLGDGSLLAS